MMDMSFFIATPADWPQFYAARLFESRGVTWVHAPDDIAADI